MRRTIYLLAAIGAALSVASPSAAQTFQKWTAAPWSVDSDGKDCLLVYRENDRQFAIAVANGDDDFYLEIKTAATRAQKPEQRIPVSISFAGQRWESTGLTMSDGALGTIIPPSSRQLMTLFRRADRVSFAVQSGETFDLAIDPAARQQFFKCEASIGGVASKSE